VVTLTYPGEEDWVPTDGRQAKAQLAAFRRRWERKWGPARGVWKLEFQRRGAVHWMIALLVGDQVDLGAVRRWTSRAWYEIVGSGLEKHRRAGTQVIEWQGDLSAYFAKYAAAKGAKEYQHEVPDWYRRVGRFWGLWRLEPEWQGGTLTPRAFVALRRVLVRYRRSRKRSRKFRAPGGLRGGWVMGGQRSGDLAAQLLRILGD
jgi:hypothetical protein